MPDEMAGAGLTAKERLQRIEDMLNRMDLKMDARFDSLSARISTIEVSGSRQAQEAENGLLAVEGRLRALETNIAPIATTVLEKAARLDSRVMALETDVAPAARAIDKQIAALNVQHEKLASSLSSVQKRVWLAAGGLGALGVAFNIAIQLGWLKV